MNTPGRIYVSVGDQIESWDLDGNRITRGRYLGSRRW